MPKRFKQVEKGIYRGGKPSSEDIEVLKNIFKINRIISLDKEAATEISPICKKFNIEHLIIPISWEEINPKIIKFLKNNIVELLEESKPTFIHCVKGKDRTGLAIALYRIAKGWDKEEAYEEAKSFRFGIGLEENIKNYFKNEILDINNLSLGKVNDLYPIAPLQDEVISSQIDTVFPATEIGNADDRRIRKRKLRKLIWEDINDAMAMVGMSEGSTPILRGLGPLEPMYIMPHSWSFYT